MNTKTAYELLTEAAHSAGERGEKARQHALQLAKALVAKHFLSDLAESAAMLRHEAVKRERGGLVANATCLHYAAGLLTNYKE